MVEKFLITNYDRKDLIALIKEAFKEELKEILVQQEKESDYDVSLSRKEVTGMLKISLVTVSKYQREGRFPYCRLERHIYFKKGDIMKAIGTPIRYQHRRYSNY